MLLQIFLANIFWHFYDRYILKTYKIPNEAYKTAIFCGRVKCFPSKHATLKLKAKGRVSKVNPKYSEVVAACKPTITYGNNINKV